jgi:hypothetical protein
MCIFLLPAHSLLSALRAHFLVPLCNAPFPSFPRRGKLSLASVIILCSNPLFFRTFDITSLFSRPLSSVEHHLPRPHHSPLWRFGDNTVLDSGTRTRLCLLDEGRGECMCYTVLHLFFHASFHGSTPICQSISRFLSPGFTLDSSLESRSSVQAQQ